ncbi:hypothetical protein Y032_0018g3690 [Ancylostoma ceylanicum]|uniref:Large ribosomal subunit protein mL42 n=1 Tax=Ancylostoma ceylanicum TaxID=53326 RepID=A0A016V3R9_9BILA|nr:hypothetical protein Y032_0018g3690 [Ancylostoma ceylanicum]
MLRAPLSVVCSRLSSSSAGKDLAKTIVVCPNGAVAAWHPETPFPYEHTRPVELQEHSAEERTPLSAAVSRANRWKDDPNNSQLKDIFYTSKHEWFTRTREERLRSVAAPPPRRK